MKLFFKQETFEVKVVDNNVYLNTPNKLSLKREDLKSLNLSNPIPEEGIASSSVDKTSDSNQEHTLTYWASKILNTPDPKEKANLTFLVADKWKNNELSVLGDTLPPEQPKRLETLNVIDPAKIRRGKGGTQVSRLNNYYFYLFERLFNSSVTQGKSNSSSPFIGQHRTMGYRLIMGYCLPVC